VTKVLDVRNDNVKDQTNSDRKAENQLFSSTQCAPNTFNT